MGVAYVLFLKIGDSDALKGRGFQPRRRLAKTDGL